MKTTPSAHTGPVLALAFDGTDALWSGDAAGRLARWPLRDGRLQQPEVVSQGEPVLGLSLQHGAVWVLRPDRLEGFPTHGSAAGPPAGPLELPGDPHRLAGRAGHLVAAGDASAAVLAWQPAEARWTVQASVPLPQGRTDDLDLAWDGRRLLVVKDLARLEVCSTRDGRREGGFRQKKLREISARFDPGSDHVYRGARGSAQIERARWKSGRGDLKLDTAANWNGPVELSPDATALAALSTGDSLQIFDLRSNRAIYYAELSLGREANPAGSELLARWRRPPDEGVLYSCLALAPEGSLAALGGTDGSLLLIEPASCRVERGVLRPAGVEPAAAAPGELVSDPSGAKERERNAAQNDAPEDSGAGTRKGRRKTAAAPPAGKARPGRGSKRPGADGQRAARPTQADLSSVQPACSRLLQQLQIRAAGRQGPELRLLDRQARLWTWRSGGELRPGLLQLPLKEWAPKFYDGRGQLFWDPECVYLRELTELRAYDAATGALAWKEPYAGDWACQATDGRLWTYDRAGELLWLELAPDGTRRGKLETGAVQRPFELPPIPAGADRLLLGSHGKGSYDPVFQLLDLKSGRSTDLGEGQRAWPGTDGRHFALCRGSEETDFEVWDGERPELGPLLVWENEDFRFGHFSEVTVAPEARRIFAGENEYGLVVWDWDGTVLAHLGGSGERLKGLVPAPDGRSLLSWDRTSSVRHWDLQAPLRAPSGQARVVRNSPPEETPATAARKARSAARQRRGAGS